MSLTFKEMERIEWFCIIEKEIDSKVSFVLDCWTSGAPYQGIIGRWINREWELREEILDLDILHGRHDGNNLCNSFVKVLEHFALIPKILAITTDNASNCDTMFECLSSTLNEKVKYKLTYLWWTKCSVKPNFYLGNCV